MIHNLRPARISPLSILSAQPARYLWRICPGMCTSQTVRSSSSSPETLWDDNIHSLMSNFLCLPHAWISYPSLKRQAGTCSDVPPSVSTCLASTWTGPFFFCLFLLSNTERYQRGGEETVCVCVCVCCRSQIPS